MQQQLKYLRNVMYQYMIGSHPERLADVISTILRFNKTQRREVIERAKSHKGWLSWA